MQCSALKSINYCTGMKQSGFRTLNLINSILLKDELAFEQRIALVQEQMQILFHMEWLISTLLKISKLDSGTIPMRENTVKVSELIEKAVSLLAVSLDLKNIHLTVQSSEQATYQGDLEWSAEALANILKNCIEHTPSGGEIQIQTEQNALFTEIVIQDNGIGITKEDLAHLFERFYRGKNTEQNYGIGLSLAKTIIKAQNGMIMAENREAGGAKFNIRFLRERYNK